MKNIFYLLITLFLVYIFPSCDKTNYNEGFDNGYSAGKSDGYNTGYEKGKKDGYNKGYSDGASTTHKDITVVESNTKYFYDVTYYWFTIGFFIIFLILLGAILYNSIAVSQHDKSLLFGKIIFFIVSLGLTYLSMKLVNLTNFIFFKIDDGWSWIVIVALFSITILISYIFHRLMGADNIYLQVLVTFFSTFILFYIMLFLTDIDSYLIHNPFYSSCIISATIGGLTYIAFNFFNQQQVKQNKLKGNEKSPFKKNMS